MIRIGVAPQLLDFIRKIPMAIDTWFKQATLRFNVQQLTSDPTTGEVPTNQWGFWKNTVSGVLSIWANDNGTLKQVPLSAPPGSAVAFRAVASANQTGLTSGASTKVTFGTETFDSNNNFASSRFTATVGGYYQINASVFFKGINSQSYVLGFQRSGAAYGNVAVLDLAASANTEVVSGSDVFQLGVGDYVEVFATIVGTAGTLQFSAGSMFSGFLIAKS